ncbi:hypothetical protein BDV95DRAFT_563226 [Massariosphaeria phaeospora]|uniref:Uncharacterized protein n=1 Tax=Massariosphaeria phaeospora TaxID=100035 RepID=A0A7C8MG16_9PLEO|nr:hypothetical protein BDV95DRAFT_563226 [Massariosphaeria phaeospora]
MYLRWWCVRGERDWKGARIVSGIRAEEDLHESAKWVPERLPMSFAAEKRLPHPSILARKALPVDRRKWKRERKQRLRWAELEVEAGREGVGCSPDPDSCLEYLCLTGGRSAAVAEGVRSGCTCRCPACIYDNARILVCPSRLSVSEVRRVFLN